MPKKVAFQKPIAFHSPLSLPSPRPSRSKRRRSRSGPRRKSRASPVRRSSRHRSNEAIGTGICLQQKTGFFRHPVVGFSGPNWGDVLVDFRGAQLRVVVDVLVPKLGSIVGFLRISSCSMLYLLLVPNSRFFEIEHLVVTGLSQYMFGNKSFEHLLIDFDGARKLVRTKITSRLSLLSNHCHGHSVSATWLWKATIRKFKHVWLQAFHFASQLLGSFAALREMARADSCVLDYCRLYIDVFFTWNTLRLKVPRNFWSRLVNQAHVKSPIQIRKLGWCLPPFRKLKILYRQYDIIWSYWVLANGSKPCKALRRWSHPSAMAEKPEMDEQIEESHPANLTQLICNDSAEERCEFFSVNLMPRKISMVNMHELWWGKILSA